MDLADATRGSKRQILKDVFGFDDFRPGQEEVVDALLADLGSGATPAKVHAVLREKIGSGSGR